MLVIEWWVNSKLHVHGTEGEIVQVSGSPRYTVESLFNRACSRKSTHGLNEGYTPALAEASIYIMQYITKGPSQASRCQGPESQLCCRQQHMQFTCVQMGLDKSSIGSSNDIINITIIYKFYHLQGMGLYALIELIAIFGHGQSCSPSIFLYMDLH